MSNILEKFYTSDRQTLVIVSFLILSAKLCLADGEYSEIEEQEILKIIPHDISQRKNLKKILDEAAFDKSPIKEDAKILKNLVGKENKDFFEFIIANLYRLAEADKEMSIEQYRDIQIVAIEFGLSKESIINKIKSIILISKTKF